MIMVRRIAALILTGLLLVGICGCEFADRTASAADERIENQQDQQESPPMKEEENADEPAESSAPSCEHVYSAATCTEPMKCETCGETDGEPDGHSWNEPDCTHPKTCAACGKTEGKAAGHSWTSETCSQPKSCDICGATEGDPVPHSYSGGKCIYCGKTDPNQSTEPMVWIPTKGGKKYHISSSCSNMDSPRQVSVAEAESLGFTPCKKCYG